MAGPYIGVVKSFNPEKGWGHIECETTYSVYSKDVFLLKSQLIGASIVARGSQVSFSIVDNGRGPEATNVQVLGGISPQPMQMTPQQAALNGSIPQAPTTGPTYVGNVKSFNPNSGWGHIQCAETQRLYQKDMFFMKSSIPGGQVAKGTPVSFMVAQGMKGPEAHNIRLLNGGGVQVPMQAPAQWPMATAYAVAAPAPPAPMPQAKSHANQIYYGTIKSFQEEKGWGHIDCAQTQALYGKDMFVLRSSLGGAVVKPGDQVMFSVVMGMKGPEATTVRVMSHTGQETFMGSIKLYHEEKGWGFIQCDEARQIYGKDIFLHSKELYGHVPSQGEPVQFSVQLSAQGRPEATSLMFPNAQGGAYTAMRQQPAAGKGRVAPF